MIKLLEFIKQNKFVLYKDGKWYSTLDFPTIFYDEIELIKLFNRTTPWIDMILENIIPKLLYKMQRLLNAMSNFTQSKIYILLCYFKRQK